MILTTSKIVRPSASYAVRHQLKCYTLTLSPLVLAMFATPVRAEESHATNNQPEPETIVVTAQQHQIGYTMPSSSVATRGNVSVMDIPKAVATVSAQVLQDQNSDSLINALTNVSGITQTNNFGGKDDAIIRRGFGASRDGSILTDGLKTALPHSFNATTEQVEVLKGPSSTLYGVLDPSGMVNLVTKKPQTEFGAKVWSKLSAMGAGRYGQKYGLDITDSISDSQFAYRFIGEYEDSDYWRNFGTNRNWTVAPSLMWSTDTTELVLSYFHQHYLIPYDRGTIYDTEKNEFVNVSPRTRLDEPLSKYEGDSDLAKISLNQTLNDIWNLDTRYAYSQDDFKANQVRTRSYNSTTGAVKRRADVRGFYKVKTHAVRSDLTGSVDLFQKQNDLLFGASYDREKTRRSKLQTCNQNSNFNVNDPTYGQMEGCTYDASSAVLEYETINTTSVYGQDQFHLNDQWILVGGLRYQQYDIVAGRGDTQNTDTNGHALLPNAGVIWKVDPMVSLYANVGKTFRPNSSMTSEYGNLDPEEGISYEVGSKFDINQRINATLAAYHARKKNVAYSETVDGMTVYNTAGLVRSQGIELDMTAQLTERLQAIGSYAYTDTKVLKDPDYEGKALPNVAKHTASLFLSYNHGNLFQDNDNLRYGGGVHGASKRAGDNDNSFYLPEYAIADLFAAYTFKTTNPIKVQLNLNNVFDKEYYTSSIGSSAYAIAVGQPFNATLDISMAFGAM